MEYGDGQSSNHASVDTDEISDHSHGYLGQFEFVVHKGVRPRPVYLYVSVFVGMHTWITASSAEPWRSQQDDRWPEASDASRAYVEAGEIIRYRFTRP